MRNITWSFLILLILFLAGCASQTKAAEKPLESEATESITSAITEQETNTTEESSIVANTSETAQNITQEVNESAKQAKAYDCGPTLTKKRQFNSDPYYTGPLVDSHIHMPSAFKPPAAIAQQAEWDAPSFDEKTGIREIICLFDAENITSVFGFYIIPSIVMELSVGGTKQIEDQYPGRIAPFITPAHVSFMDLKPADVERILNSNKGLFKGYGEIAMYKGDYKDLSPDDQKFLEIYKIADKHKLIVMMHPDNGQRQAIEKILKNYPNVIFLFHGPESEPWIEEVVGKYPNAYYTIDGSLWDIPNEFQGVNLYDAKNKEEFIYEFKRDYDTVFNGAIAKWKGPIERYPDKFLWGTDRGGALWHFDPEVGALLEEIGRSFIGKLKPEVQEKFAYKNAEKLLEER